MLKYLAENINYRNNFSKYCVSNKGKGGTLKAIKTVYRLLKTHKYIYKSDIKSFYNSINHKILLSKLPAYTLPNECKLIAKHLDRIQWQDGEYVEIKQGISKSSPLSPVLGCIYLDELDKAMEKLNIKYLRYADDWIILAKTKHKLRKAVKKCKQILSKLQLKEHPDKTDYRNFNNPISKPFNFLGVEFNQNGAKDIKKQTKENFSIKITRLYECIQVIAKIKTKINTSYDNGESLYKCLNMLELVLVKKFIKCLAGFGNYFKSITLVPS
ncbi:reverse transcriptase/maturase family protein [Allofrancisella frigidaquae]|uniref:reverse transcriptase/maturase family protein n=1 Tax=Allofrancisella frigidaquae TaxID=1085644 RepID=UPI001FD898CB|nr:reverse transcriptase/maturase family protein [Allofrancisella frigidaquae]